jgi:hypothetical protein
VSEVDDWLVLVELVVGGVPETVQATSVAPATPATAIPVVTRAIRRRPVSRAATAQP